MPDFLAEALTWPENQGIRTALKTARSWNVPPLLILTGEDAGWTDLRNRMLSVALTVLDDETCTSCGTPVWYGHSTNNEIQFKVQATVCYGCAEIERTQNARVSSTGQAKRKPTPGESLYVTPYHVWHEHGHRLPTRHEEYVRGLE